jgi:hypothetical protein
VDGEEDKGRWTGEEDKGRWTRRRIRDGGRDGG